MFSYAFYHSQFTLPRIGRTSYAVHINFLWIEAVRRCVCVFNKPKHRPEVFACLNCVCCIYTVNIVGFDDCVRQKKTPAHSKCRLIMF